MAQNRFLFSGPKIKLKNHSLKSCHHLFLNVSAWLFLFRVQETEEVYLLYLQIKKIAVALPNKKLLKKISEQKSANGTKEKMPKAWALKAFTNLKILLPCTKKKDLCIKKVPLRFVHIFTAVTISAFYGTQHRKAQHFMEGEIGGGSQRVI